MPRRHRASVLQTSRVIVHRRDSSRPSPSTDDAASVDGTVNHSLQFDPIGVIESATFRRWIRSLKDRAVVARINARLRRVSRGNLGDTKAVAHGLFEMRVHHGPGYRLYLRDGNAVVVLCGGTKGSQRYDIEHARRLAQDWRRT